MAPKHIILALLIVLITGMSYGFAGAIPTGGVTCTSPANDTCYVKSSGTLTAAFTVKGSNQSDYNCTLVYRGTSYWTTGGAYNKTVENNTATTLVLAVGTYYPDSPWYVTCNDNTTLTTVSCPVRQIDVENYCYTFTVTDTISAAKDVFGGLLKGVADNSYDLGSMMILGVFIALFLPLLAHVLGIMPKLKQWFRID
jgi:hypothetical protein